MRSTSVYAERQSKGRDRKDTPLETRIQFPHLHANALKFRACCARRSDPVIVRGMMTLSVVPQPFCRSTRYCGPSSMRSVQSARKVPFSRQAVTFFIFIDMVHSRGGRTGANHGIYQHA